MKKSLKQSKIYYTNTHTRRQCVSWLNRLLSALCVSLWWINFDSFSLFSCCFFYFMRSCVVFRRSEERATIRMYAHSEWSVHHSMRYSILWQEAQSKHKQTAAKINFFAIFMHALYGRCVKSLHNKNKVWMAGKGPCEWNGEERDVLAGCLMLVCSLQQTTNIGSVARAEGARKFIARKFIKIEAVIKDKRGNYTRKQKKRKRERERKQP